MRASGLTHSLAYGGRYEDSHYILIFLPFIPFSVALTMSALAFLWARLVHRSRIGPFRIGLFCETQQDARRYFMRWMGRTVPFLNILYTNMCVRSLQLFMCMPLRDGTSVLMASPEIRCWESREHQSMVIVAVFGLIVWVVGIPAYVSTSIYYAHRHDKLKDPDCLAVFGYLYRKYRESPLAASVNRSARSIQFSPCTRRCCGAVPSRGHCTHRSWYRCVCRCTALSLTLSGQGRALRWVVCRAVVLWVGGAAAHAQALRRAVRVAAEGQTVHAICAFPLKPARPAH